MGTATCNNPLQLLQNIRRLAEEAQEKAVEDALLVGLSDLNASESELLLQPSDSDVPSRASGAAASPDDAILRFSTSHHLRRVDGILTAAPFAPGEQDAERHRLSLPDTDADDEVHLEGDVMSEIGRQKGVHNIDMHFFSLRTVKSTGVK